MRSVLRACAATAVAGGLLLGGSGVASAHECFVVTRSAQGATMAAKSGNWVAVPREHLLADLSTFLVEDFGATPAQVDCAVAKARAVLPEVVAIGVGPAKGTDHVIAANQNPKNAANGKGVDHLMALLMPILADCGIA